MAAEDAALRRLAAQNGDAVVGDRLAQGRALVAERFGAKAEPLAPGSLGDLVVRRSGAVWRVVVGGRVVVEDGRLTTADYESIAAEARVQATRLWSRMAAI
jgi:cytosine/adenosine deaminase-related metal-dependent hydrolase